MLGHQSINPIKTDRDLASIKNDCLRSFGISEAQLAAKFKSSNIEIPYVLINEDVDVFKTPYTHLYLSVLFFILGEKEFTTLCKSYLPETQVTEFVATISAYWPNIQGNIEFELSTIQKLIDVATEEQGDLFFLNFISSSDLHSRYILTVLLIKNLILSSHSFIIKLFNQLNKFDREFIIVLAIQNPEYKTAKLIFDSLSPNEFSEKISLEIKRIIERNNLTEEEDKLLLFCMTEYSQYMPNTFSKLTDQDYSNLVRLLIKKENPTLALLVKNTCDFFYADQQLNKLSLILFALITAEKLNFAAIAYLVKTYPVLLAYKDIEKHRYPLIAFLDAQAMHVDRRIEGLINIMIPLSPPQIYQNYFMTLMQTPQPSNHYLGALVNHLATADNLKQAFGDLACDSNDFSSFTDAALLGCISKFVISYRTCFPGLSSDLCFNLFKLMDVDYLKKNGIFFLLAAEKINDEIMKKVVNGFFKEFLKRKLTDQEYQLLINKQTESTASTSAPLSSNTNVLFVSNPPSRKRSAKGKELAAQKRPK